MTEQAQNAQPDTGTSKKKSSKPRGKPLSVQDFAAKYGYNEKVVRRHMREKLSLRVGRGKTHKPLTVAQQKKLRGIMGKSS